MRGLLISFLFFLILIDSGTINEMVEIEIKNENLVGSVLEEIENVEEKVETEESISIEVPRNRTRQDGRVQLALSRICASEAGFQVDTDDCLMIYEVLRNRSNTGEVTMGIMRAYATNTFRLNRVDSRRWVPYLNDQFREPRYWRDSSSIPWSRRQGGYINVYHFVGRMMRGEVRIDCDERIDHWGAPHFRRRQHLRNGWRIVSCGDTRNVFWTLPDRRRNNSR
jgi:hypothetical protein